MMNPFGCNKKIIMLAPMAGYTDRTMRKLCTELGAGLTFTEMISSKALVFSNERTLSYLSFDDFKTGIQLFGNEPDVMAKAAEIICEDCGDNIALFDINMGCPAPKIYNNGDGCALMKNPELASEIVSAVKEAVDLPVSVKIRKGCDGSRINAVDFAMRLEAAGADFITVHGRTREQYYSGVSDREIIKEVKNALKIPVIGNGDIFTPENAAAMLDETGCDGVMVARGALGNPFIFAMIKDYLKTGTYTEPSLAEKKELAKRHVKMVCEDKGEYVGLRELRKHLCFYIKGIRGAARIKEKLVRAESVDEVLSILDSLD